MERLTADDEYQFSFTFLIILSTVLIVLFSLSLWDVEYRLVGEGWRGFKQFYHEAT